MKKENEIRETIKKHIYIPAKPSLHGICETRIFQLRADVIPPAIKLLVIMVSVMGVVLLYPIFKYTIYTQISFEWTGEEFFLL